MSSEQYLLDINFALGLESHILEKNINDNILINKTCSGIRTVNNDVYVDFNDNLLIEEKNELDNIVNGYVYTLKDSVDDRYLAVTFDFDSVTSLGVASSNHIILNSGYNMPTFDTSTGELVINKKGIYTFSLFYDNKSVLNATDFYKIYMSEQTGSEAIYSRNVVSRSEQIGDLNQVISSTIVIPSGQTYLFTMKQILGSGSESFNCVLQVIRIE